MLTNNDAARFARSPFSASRLAQQAVDLGLMSIIFLAPLVMGGRHPTGRFVFVGLVCATTIVCVLRQFIANGHWRSSRAAWLMVAAVGLLVMQLVPLSPAMLDRLSPKLAELLPAWSAPSENGAWLGNWSQLSLTPVATRESLVMLLAYGMLFMVVLRRLGGVEDVERLFRWLAIAAVVMAAFGICQLLFSNGKFFWFYEHPFRNTHRTVKGAFTNENHFAHFLALGIGPLIWWLQSLGRRETDHPTSTHRLSHRHAKPIAEHHDIALYAMGFALACVTLAGLLTFSRGGIIAVFIVLAVCVAMYARRGLLRKRILWTLTGIGALVCVSLFVFGYEPLMSELRTVGAGSIEQLDGKGSRRKLWRADMAAAADFPLLGTGAGSHAEVYPVYFDDFAEVKFTHAESGYVQVMQESGGIGISLLGCGIAICAFWSISAARESSSPQVSNCGIVVMAALLVSVVHSIWDFVWYIPGCMSLTVILMACACRLHQLRPAAAIAREPSSQPAPLGRPLWGVTAVAVVALTAVMLHELVGPARATATWDSYLRTVMALRDRDVTADSQIPIRSMIHDLEQTLQHDPHNARAHARLANLLLLHFNERQQHSENPVMLAQIRNAVIASKFSSRRAQDAWLNVAIGKNRKILDAAYQHARRAAQLSPLQGNCYVDLAGLAFLDGHGEEVSEAYLQQALRVRPNSGSVQFAAGRRALMRGDTAAGIAFWRAAFRHDPPTRQRIIAVLAASMPASFFLSEFEPDIDGLRALYQHFRQLGRDEEAREAGQLYANLLVEQIPRETGAEVPRSWFRAYKVFAYCRQRSAALECLQRAVAAAPDNFPMHRELAIQLLVGGDFEQAEEQLRWCLRRKPDDEYLHDLSVKIRRRQSDEPRTATDAGSETSRF